MESVHKKRNTLRWLLIGVIAWPSALLAGDNPAPTITKRNAFNLGAEPRLIGCEASSQPTDIKLWNLQAQWRGAPSPCSSRRQVPNQFLQLARGEAGGCPCRDHRPQKTVTLTVNGKQRSNFKTTPIVNRHKGQPIQRIVQSIDSVRDRKRKRRRRRKKSPTQKNWPRLTSRLHAEKFHRHPLS